MPIIHLYSNAVVKYDFYEGRDPYRQKSLGPVKSQVDLVILDCGWPAI